jgi:hypothetical protein
LSVAYADVLSMFGSGGGDGRTEMTRSRRRFVLVVMTLALFVVFVFVAVHAQSQRKPMKQNKMLFRTSSQKHDRIPLIYVHLGNNPAFFPSYLTTSIRQAIRWTPNLAIYVIMTSNKSVSLSLHSTSFPESKSFWDKHVTVVYVENIPVGSVRKNFLNSKFDSNSFLSLDFFRDNFWLKAAERLFVLYDALSFLKIDEAFHMECDNMLYLNLNDYMPFFRSLYPGLGAPTKSSTGITFGFLYVHTSASLLQMLQNFIINPGQNEMHAAHLYETEFGSSRLGRLPVVPPEALLDNSYEEIFSPNLHAAKGVFDGAPHGQYLGGTNPENIKRDFEFYSRRRGGGRAGFIEDDELPYKPDKLFYTWSTDNSEGLLRPYVSLNNYSRGLPIFQLHVHCKDLISFES